MLSSTKARWFSGLFLMGVCGSLVIFFLNSIWAVSIDLALHYAVVARISEQWQLPDDRSLEQLSVFPRYSHRLAAIAGNLIGSPLAGMQLVALFSLTAVWSGIALMFFSLPRRMLGIVFGTLTVLLLVNRFFVHLELFGTELVGNYFFPQVVAQGSAVMLVALVLWIEKARIPTVVSYLILGCSAPIVQHFHLLPALEVLATLALLTLLNLFDRRNKDRWVVFTLGLFATLASLSFIVFNPIFAAVRKQSENNGVLQLTYISNLTALTLECLIVIAISSYLIWHWTRLQAAEVRTDGLVFKYLGLLGLAIAGLCLLQVLMLKIGYGSEYACKKYVFGLNTVLVLDIPLLLIALLTPLHVRFIASEGESWELPAMLFQRIFLGTFVLVAVSTALPLPSAKRIAVSEIVTVERLVRKHGRSSSSSVKYDYGIGLFDNDAVFDYLITIGALKAPPGNNATDLLFGYPLSYPRRIDRIFTREGSKPWDIPECRSYLSPDGFAILDGQCVLARISTAQGNP